VILSAPWCRQNRSRSEPQNHPDRPWSLRSDLSTSQRSDAVQHYVNRHRVVWRRLRGCCGG
jgi:hypothetical protein